MNPQIEKLKNEFRSKDVKGLALDIDETLSDTVGWWFSRMIELFGNPEDLSPSEIFDKYKHSKYVPYWQSDEANAWKEERRFDDNIQEEFELVEDNLSKVVQDISEIVPIVTYITARPLAVRNGTLKWLEKHNFPKAELVQRPNDMQAEDGNEWKAGVLKALYPVVIGIVDDNADLVEHLEPDYQGTVFLYKYEKSPVNGNIDVFPCKTWDKVLEQVNDRYR